MVTVLPPSTPATTSPVPSRVFPLPGWSGPINTHWGKGIVGGSDLMVKSSGTQPVVSMVSGTVEYVATQATASHSGGNSVQIHGIDGLDYYYAHLAAPLGLKLGDTVNAGQLLGLADSTGDAAGGPPHLHIGIGHGIVTGVGATGGTGKGFDAVAMLRSLVGNPSANNPSIVSSDTQKKISTSTGAGTINVGTVGNAPTSSSLSDRIRWLAGLLAEAGAPEALIPQMVAISLAENGGSDPNATSSTHDIGLFQINIPTWAQKLGLTVDQLRDPLTNAKAAVAVLKAQGLTAWSTHNAGLDAPLLPQVTAALQGVTLPGADSTDPSGGGDTSGGDCNCQDWQLGSIGPVSLHIPDLGCVIGCQINKIIQTWKDNFTKWWTEWTTAHVANWGFVIVGAILMIVGVAALIGGSKQYNQMAQSVASSTAPKQEE